MTDYYLDLDAVANGDGSTGSPWGNQGDWIDDLVYALGQMAGDLSGGGHTLHIRGSGEYTATSANNISVSASNTWSNASAANRLIMRAETRPSGSLEGLRLRRNIGGNPFFYLNVVGATLDGIGLRNNGGGSFNAKCLQLSVANTQFLNAMAFIDSGGQNSGDAIEVTSSFDAIENVVAIGGSSSGRGINVNAGSVSGTIRNGVLGGADGAARRFASSGTINVHNTLHLDGDGAWTSNNPNGGNNNATLGAGTPAWGASWVTSVVLANDVVDDSSDDYRAQEGGALDQAGSNADAPAEDMFGNTRENPPSIGHSIAASAGDVTEPTVTVAPALGTETDTTIPVTTTATDASGTYEAYAVAVADGATAPSAAQVKAGNDSTDSAALSSDSALAVTSGAQAALSLAGLSAATDYDVYVVVTDAAGNDVTGHPVLLNATTAAAPDGTAPTITVAPAVTPGIGSATVTATATDASGTFNLYIAAVANDAAAPSASQIRAGTGGGIVAAASDTGVTSGQQASAQITGLDRFTAFDVYALVDDASQNVVSGHPAKLDVTTQKTTLTDTVLGDGGTPAASQALQYAILEEDLTQVVGWTGATTDGSGVLAVDEPAATAAGQARVLLIRATGGGAGVAAGASIIATAVA